MIYLAIEEMSMVAVKTRFDGEKIEVPAELRGAPPGEVIVLFDHSSAVPHSFWEFVGKHPNPKTGRELDAIIEEERRSWGDE
jgi:hypothetical protein